MAAQLSKMSYIFKRSCTLLSKVVTTYTTLVTLQLWKVAKVVESTIGRFPDVIAIVRMAAITSNEPFSTRLSGRDGSYSQMAVEVSTAASFVMWFITSTSARLTT